MSDFEDVGPVDALAVLRGMADPANEFHAAAIASAKELLEAAREFDRTYVWHWDRVDGAAVIMPDRVDAFEERAERLRIAIARFKGA